MRPGNSNITQYISYFIDDYDLYLYFFIEMQNIVMAQYNELYDTEIDNDLLIYDYKNGI